MHRASAESAGRDPDVHLETTTAITLAAMGTGDPTWQKRDLSSKDEHERTT